MADVLIGKVCAKCGLYKEANEFHVDHRSGSGLTSRCKKCRGVIGQPRRVSVPQVLPAVWINAFLHEQVCFSCDSDDVGLFVDGVLIADAPTVQLAKAFARRGDVLCNRCVGNAPKSVKYKLRAKRHKERMDELLNTADTLADLYMKARTNKRVAELLDKGEFDHVYLQNVAVEKLLQRHDRTAEKREQYPILTAEKKDRIAHRERKYGLWKDLLE